MPLQLNTVFIAIFIISLVTFLTRLFPFVSFRKIQNSSWITYFEKSLPPMIMGVLVLYSLKDAGWTEIPYGMPELICSTVTVLLHIWKKQPLISITGGTVLYMFFIQTGIIEQLIHYLTGG